MHGGAWEIKLKWREWGTKKSADQPLYYFVYQKQNSLRPLLLAKKGNFNKWNGKIIVLLEELRMQGTNINSTK